MISQDVQIVGSDEQKNHNVRDTKIVKFDSIVQAVTFDDEHTYPGDSGDRPEDCLDTTEDGNLDEVVSSGKENTINLNKFTYFPTSI